MCWRVGEMVRCISEIPLLIKKRQDYQLWKLKGKSFCYDFEISLIDIRKLSAWSITSTVFFIQKKRRIFPLFVYIKKCFPSVFFLTCLLVLFDACTFWVFFLMLIYNCKYTSHLSKCWINIFLNFFNDRCKSVICGS